MLIAFNWLWAKLEYRSLNRLNTAKFWDFDDSSFKLEIICFRLRIISVMWCLHAVQRSGLLVAYCADVHAPHLWPVLDAVATNVTAIKDSWQCHCFSGGLTLSAMSCFWFVAWETKYFRIILAAKSNYNPFLSPTWSLSLNAGNSFVPQWIIIYPQGVQISYIRQHVYSPTFCASQYWVYESEVSTLGDSTLISLTRASFVCVSSLACWCYLHIRVATAVSFCDLRMSPGIKAAVPDNFLLFGIWGRQWCCCDGWWLIALIITRIFTRRWRCRRVQFPAARRMWQWSHTLLFFLMQFSFNLLSLFSFPILFLY